MTQQEKRIKIAEACQSIACKNINGDWVWREQQSRRFDPLNDLNAMHEAEKVSIIGDEQLEEKYWMTLYDVTTSTRWPFDARAAQRAEAFGLTLGLWK